MSSHAHDATAQATLELPVAELLRRARPLPPRDELVIEDLSEAEGELFLAALAR
jgi:hypothetical protein